MTNPFNNFSWIIEGFIAASEYPDSEEKLQFLKNQGIKSIVTLSEKRIDEDLIKKYKFRYLFLPIKDFDIPSIEDIKIFVNWIKLMEKWRNPVLVHCDAGIGRTGTMLTIYFLSQGKSVEESLRIVKNRRNFAVESLKQEKFIYQISSFLPFIIDSEEKVLFDIFYKTVKVLRNECPWDKKQTKDSLLKYFESEFNELKEAILKRDIENTKEELGDLLLEVMLQIVIGEESNEFSLKDVLSQIIDKLVLRHPHVFKDEIISSAEEVENRWEELKKNSI